MALNIPFPGAADTANIFIRVRREELVFLNGVIESFDDLAVVKTLDAGQGIAVVMTTPGEEGAVRRILDSMAGDIGLEYLHPDDDVSALYREQIYGLA